MIEGTANYIWSVDSSSAIYQSEDNGSVVQGNNITVYGLTVKPVKGNITDLVSKSGDIIRSQSIELHDI